MDNLSTTTSSPVQNSLSVAEWQRVSPIAMVYFLTKFIKGFVGNFVYLAPALVVGYETILDNLTIAVPILFALISLFFIGVFLSYYFFQFRLINQHIHIRSGVLAKKYVNLPYERVQNIQLLQPVYYRPFGFTCLQLDTAGSNKQEANIVALPLRLAEHIKREILSHIESEHANAVSASIDHRTDNDSKTSEYIDTRTPEEHTLITRSINDLVIHGLSNNRIWILLGGLAPFYENIQTLVISVTQRLGVDIEKFVDTHIVTTWQITFFALGIFLLVSLLVMLMSILGAIISYYGFTLSKSSDRYIRRSGLLSKHEVTMKQRRLQMIISAQSWLDRVFRRVNLKFEQNSSQATQNGIPNDNNKIIIPSVTYQQRSELINEAFVDNYLDHIKYKPISKRFITRYVLYWFTPICLLMIGVLIFNQAIHLVWAPVAALILLSIMTYYRWRRWGYARDDLFIYVRKGFIGTDHFCFPIAKIQQVKWIQSVFLKPRKLGHTTFVLASGAVKVPYIPEQDGLEMVNFALHHVEVTRLSWM